MSRTPKTNPAQSPRLLTITFFRSVRSTHGRREKLTLDELALQVQDMVGNDVHTLPLLKMASFKGPRSDAAMGPISGIELDHDKGGLTYEEAIERLIKANVTALVYTTRRHAPGVQERFRVLMPTSQDLPKAARYALVQRANGIFDGRLANESFIDAQTYFYGRVQYSDVPYQVEIIDGRYIDLCDDLGEGWPEAISERGKASLAGEPWTEADEAALEKHREWHHRNDENGWHFLLLRKTASLLSKGSTPTETAEICGPYCNGGKDDPDLWVMIDGAIARGIGPRPVPATIGEFIKATAKAAGVPVPEPSMLPANAKLTDFYAFLPTHQYLYRPTGALWPMASINTVLDKITIGQKEKKQTKKDKEAGLPIEMVDVQIPAHLWLDRNAAVMGMTWAPGLPELIKGKVPIEDGWVEHRDAATFNSYRAPQPIEGDPAGAKRWRDFLARIYPNHVDHITAFMAHRVQKPEEKINHGLVLTGSPGIGKDTLLEPLRYGVGPWNFKEVSPHDLTGNNTDFMRSVVLRVSETRDLGEISRYAFYEATKTMLAAPPAMARVNIKHVPQFYVPNVTGVIFTTNYPYDGLYLPPDDRRHYVCGSELIRNDAWDAHCAALWAWYASGGLACVVAYLRSYDLSRFSPGAPPEKTATFLEMVDTGRPVEDAEIRSALAALKNPDAVTLGELVAASDDYDLKSWLMDRKNRRNIARLLDACGYSPVRNADEEGGRWLVARRRVIIYGKRSLPGQDRYRAAEILKARLDEEWKALNGKLMPKKPQK